MRYSKSARGKGSIRNRKYEKILVFGLLIGLFISPFFLYSMMSNQPVRSNIDVNPKENLKVNDFSKDDYEPILTDKQQSLGEIIVKDLEFDENFDDDGFYNISELQEELATVLDFTSIEISSWNMQTGAKLDNQGPDSENSKRIILKLTDTIDVEYNMSKGNAEQEYLVYRPKLGSINTETLSLDAPLEDKNLSAFYSIDDNEFLNFEYFEYFENNSHEFTMYIDYTYNIPLINWTMNQNDINNLVYKNETIPLYPKFTYRFNVSTDVVPGDSYSAQRAPTENIRLDLNITLPNKDQIYNHSLTVNNVGLSPNTYLTGDNIINLTLPGNNSEFLLNFNTKFTMKFEKPVENTWAIDRLIEQNDVRERIYFPTIISGPNKIYFYVSILENTISSDQVRSTESLFEREVSYSSVDTRDVEEEIGESLVFTEQASVKQGIKVRLPFILPNETVPFSIKYQVTENLRIVVTDNIDMPAQNLRLKVYYQGKEYGSYISVDKVLPLADLTTNANGEVSINNAPNGFYRVEVYQGNNLLANTTISSYQRTNYITTDIPHFPTTIIIFSSVNAILLAAGAFIYIRNSNGNRKL
jgi:hypothetical protein